MVSKFFDNCNSLHSSTQALIEFDRGWGYEWSYDIGEVKVPCFLYCGKTESMGEEYQKVNRAVLMTQVCVSSTHDPVMCVRASRFFPRVLGAFSEFGRQVCVYEGFGVCRYRRQISEGHFSAVSTPPMARVGSLREHFSRSTRHYRLFHR